MARPGVSGVSCGEVCTHLFGVGGHFPVQVSGTGGRTAGCLLGRSMARASGVRGGGGKRVAVRHSLLTSAGGRADGQTSLQLDQLVGNVLVETQSGGYLSAVDDGTLTTALPRPPDTAPENMPEPQDIITMVKVSESRVAFKTAYGRYITSLPDSGDAEARTEAMGVRELWQPIQVGDGSIWQFKSADRKLLCASVPGTPAHARAASTEDQGVLFRVHSAASIEKAKPKKRGDYTIEGGSLANMEASFAKKFQSYQNLCFKEGQTVKVSKEERKRLKEARRQGKLHEELLDRRSKLKADRYCK